MTESKSPLQVAKEIAALNAVHESPDARSVPLLLNGILHALIAVAEAGDRAVTCPHGATGLCMSCVVANDLLRVSS